MAYKKQEILKMIKEEIANGVLGDSNFYKILKAKTLTDANITLIGDYYRYVNHEDRLATTGFGTQYALLKWTDTFRFDAGTIPLMQKRYSELYNPSNQANDTMDETDSAGALGAMGAEGGGTYVTALDQTRKNKIYEVDTAGALGGGYSAENAKTGGFFIGPLGHIPRKELNKRLAFKDGQIVTQVNGQPVTEQMLLEWFGGSQVKGFNAKPFWKGGKFVEIKPKCLTFPYCSEGDSADKPIKLIGETKEASSPCSWGIVELIAERANKTPESIAKIIREHYLKLELL